MAFQADKLIFITTPMLSGIEICSFSKCRQRDGVSFLANYQLLDTVTELRAQGYLE